jgi:hypothetical protein
MPAPAVMKRHYEEVEREMAMNPPPTTPPLSSTTSVSFAKCSQWLESHHVQGFEHVEFRQSDSCQSYGCYAKKDFNIGDIIFEIPQECLFGFHHVHETILTQVIMATTQRMNLQNKLSPELILWLHMIEQRSNETLPFHEYFSSLSPLSPTVENWSGDYLQFLDGTNLASTLNLDHDSFDNLFDLLNEIWLSYQEVLQHPSHSLVSNRRTIDWKINIFTPSSLRWARGQYLSRRYPERFIKIEEKAIEFRRNLPSQNEVSFGTMGVMVPLLDILNHNDGAEWLDFKIQETNNTLQIICNSPVKMVRQRTPSVSPFSAELSTCLGMRALLKLWRPLQ